MHGFVAAGKSALICSLHVSIHAVSAHPVTWSPPRDQQCVSKYTSKMHMMRRVVQRVDVTDADADRVVVSITDEKHTLS